MRWIKTAAMAALALASFEMVSPSAAPAHGMAQVLQAMPVQMQGFTVGSAAPMDNSFMNMANVNSWYWAQSSWYWSNVRRAKQSEKDKTKVSSEKQAEPSRGPDYTFSLPGGASGTSDSTLMPMSW